MKNTIVLLVAIFLVACGGGDGGTSETQTTPSTDPNTVFLFGDANRNPNVGDTETWNLTGKTDTGESVSMNYTLKNTGTTNYNGVSVKVMDLLVAIKIPAFSFDMTSILNIYYDNNGGFVRSYDTNTGNICLPTTNSPVPPNTVKVGDFGSLPSESCNDGTTITGTWRIEGADATHANVIMNTTSRDSFNSIILTTTLTYKIDTSGNVSTISYDMSFYDSGSVSFTVSLNGSAQ